MPVFYITEPDEIADDALKLFPPEYRLIKGDVTLRKYFNPDIEGLIIRSNTRVTAELLHRLPHLQTVIRIGVGLDMIDVDACQKRGIRIYNAAGANAHSVAEYVVGMMITALRHWQELTPESLQSWNRFQFMGSELRGKMIGIVGFGHVGRLVFEKLKSFRCYKFVVYDPFVEPSLYDDPLLEFKSDLVDIFLEAQVITLHLPLTASTRHLINERLLTKMPEGSVLINSSRGGIVDEAVVVEIMKHKQGMYAADVFETEPEVPSSFINSPHVIATPHIAAMTTEAHDAMACEAIENYLAGKDAVLPPVSIAVVTPPVMSGVV